MSSDVALHYIQETHSMFDAPYAPSQAARRNSALRCADLFCGIGGFHIAAANLGLNVVFACDIDDEARKAYQHNFGAWPSGDIVAIPSADIPDHDILLAGFPCQPFSIIGNKLGTNDPRGTLYKEILRIAQDKKPQGIVLENVKQLATAQHGAVLNDIIQPLREMGYTTDWKILNALDLGLPQKRERTIIVATLELFDKFPWPVGKVATKPLSEILEWNPDSKHFVSERIRAKRRAAHQPTATPSIWHENKGGHISSYEWSCALRAGASYNYLLVDGERRLTPREMLRLQGFPDSFEITCNDSQTKKQAGNAVPVPMAEAAIKGVIDVIKQSQNTWRRQRGSRPIPAGTIP